MLECACVAGGAATAGKDDEKKQVSYSSGVGGLLWTLRGYGQVAV